MTNISTFKDFVNRLKQCTGEDVGPHEGVSAVYSAFFASVFKNTADRAFGCDGYWLLPEFFSPDGAYMLTEYKFGRNLKSKLELAKVLAQCAYYIHKFIDAGRAIPKVVCIGDENESVFLSGEVLWKAVGKSTNYPLSPSGAAGDENLMRAIMDSPYFDNLFVFNMDESCDLEGFIQTIKNIASAGEDEVLIEVTEHNIDKIWMGFKEIVFGKRKKGVEANEQVSVFVHYITNHWDFIVDDAKGRFSLNGKVYTVADPKQFKAFRKHFGYVRSMLQKERLRATCDRFIEDQNRRKKGEFYTPTAFVDYAHKMIAKEFGENWKDEYVVWDCAWGTGNLTRDYKFKELYCSTLEQAELDIAAGVNPEATKFQYDFLNDPFEKLPEGLQKAFMEGKKILFLINPPYGTAQAGSGKGVNKKGIAKTKVNEKMLEDGIGSASQNLYAQFLYRIARMKEVNPNIGIALFSPSLFLTGTAWKGFRKDFLSSFKYIGAIQFRADHFADVAANWGIMFSMWRNGMPENITEFPCTCVDRNAEGDIVEVATKMVYNNDGGKSCSDWIKEDIKKLKGEDAPQMTSALNYRDTGNLRGKLVKGAFGYYVNIANNINENAQGATLLSSCASRANGISILPQNFNRVVANFAARSMIKGNWMNYVDEYMVPNTEDPRYEEFQNDSIVYSLFDSKSNQSSLRQITYKGKLWDIKNEFFWMSRDEMVELADKHGFEELFNDAKASSERFVFKKLQGIELSSEAQAVLEKASEIVRKSFEYREEVHRLHPEWHLNAWDAGWYQVKKLVAEIPFLAKDMEEFKTLFKALSEKMRPMVYELGFLKN